MNKCKGPTCPKGGVKIHNSNNDYKTNPFQQNNSQTFDSEQELFYQKIKQQNRHTGVRIEDYKNAYNIDPFEGINPFSNPNQGEKDTQNVTYTNNSLKELDLNIESYSHNDLFKLFGFNTSTLTEDMMREAKKIVLKTHPDKSRLEPKYFLFFSQAYKKIFQIYEFQNKSAKKQEDKNEYKDETHAIIIDKLFEKNKDLKNPKNFNNWFNEQFEKHRIENPNEVGYGDWLKSNEGIINVGNVTQANMAEEMEKQKRQVQMLTTYKGVSEISAPSFSGSSLMDTSTTYTSGSLFSSDGMGYTDLRQAYVESVIPVTADDFQKVKQFKNVNDYNTHRESVDITPLQKEEAMKQLYYQNKQKDEESAALAYYYAKQAEKAKQNQDSFWSGLKQLTNWT